MLAGGHAPWGEEKVKDGTADTPGGHAPWGERLLLDQIAIGTPRAMDVFAG